jgi:hypothetical protein
MKTKYRFALVAIPLAILTFFLSLVIWPNPAGVAGPSSDLVPYFMFVSFLECLAFGVGIAFLLFGWPLLSQFGQRNRLTVATFLAVTWSLISWWPHDNMHRVNGGDNFSGLIRIELLFHVTLIISSFIIVTYIWRLLSRSQA